MSTHLIDPELLEILVCPECKVDVSENGPNSSLDCPSCKRQYPVRDGIPVMLISEAVRPDVA